ncbi:hypothetical protein ACWCXX_01410 [Streptomyces sp. NPDC001732]
MTVRDLPPVDELTGQQRRGANCCFCGSPLLNGTAHDLGPRPVDAHGTSALWFPRCCPLCWKDHG